MAGLPDWFDEFFGAPVPPQNPGDGPNNLQVFFPPEPVVQQVRQPIPGNFPPGGEPAPVAPAAPVAPVAPEAPEVHIGPIIDELLGDMESKYYKKYIKNKLKYLNLQKKLSK